MRQRNNIVSALLLIVIAVTTAGCSTTRRLADGEVLYTGVKKIDIEAPKGQKVPSGVADALTQAVAVKPNNPLLGSYRLRTPFPLGLWVYNNWSNPPKGFKHWIYEKLVEEPVLISDVRPEVRVKMLDEILDNNGYFSGSASYSLVQGKNKRKAKIRYDIATGPAYVIDSIEPLADDCHLNHLIDSVVAKDSYLRPGARYSTDSLSATRVRVANAARRQGYYFFRPEFIEYLADSTINRHHIAMKLSVANNISPRLLQRYVTGDVTTYIFRNDGGGTPDTVATKRGTLIQMMPSKFRRQLINECVTFRQGRYFSVRDMDRTQNYLSRLGIFSAISINVVPDSLSETPHLDVAISCTIDRPLEASIEVNASSKSNSYIGPGATFGVTNRNLFGGGELLNVSLTGSYEWQTGSEENRSLFNSYEAGINASLSFPRLLAPSAIRRRRREINWTRITLGADLLNRPHYFELAQFNASFGYDWRVTRYASSSLTLMKLTYNKLIKATDDFDRIMDQNHAIALSFQDQFIPQIAYTYTYDRSFGADNAINWTATVQEAGNIFWCLWQATGSTGEKRLFGTPFSQFIKGAAQLVYSRRVKGDNWLVGRVGVGAEHAYGNSSAVPYSEQFYVGGANSIRAFAVRGIGPGSYHAPSDMVNGYFDQTGTFKFEMNVEYRFPIVGALHGALFLDSGNVWLLKNDPKRPGGQLRASTFWRDLALGTGAGLRYDIGMMVIRGDLGIGIHAPYDTGRHGYYNMTSFGNSLAFHLAIGYPF